MLKKITSTFLSLVIVLYMVTLAFPTAQALENEYDSAKNYALNTTENGTNNSFDTASNISVNQSYKGQITLNDGKDYYKFVLKESSKVNLKISANIEGSNYYLYGSNKNEIWKKTAQYWDENNNIMNINEDIYLNSGTYYFLVDKYSDYEGTYTFSTTVTSAEETFSELENGSNNDFDEASNITLGNEIKGQISVNDGKDYYKFVLKESSKVNLKISANIEGSNYYLYGSNKNEIWKKTAQYWDENNNIMNINEDIYLNSGTYYFLVDKYSDYEGTYTFSTTVTSAEETFSELENGSNNDFDEASNITLGNEIKGQISVNDGKDYYKFVLKESSKVNLKISANIEGSNYYLYGSNKNEIWKKTAQYWDENNNIMNINEDIYLNSGTYYFLVDKYSDYEGTYTFSTTVTSAEETFSELENGSNNDFDEASNITLGNEIKGQISVNDGKDYYKFTLDKTGKVELKINAMIEGSSYFLYDSDENEIWKKTAQYWDENNKKCNIRENFYLNAGTYYLLINKYSDYDGFYTLTTKFTPSNETFSESQYGSNNDFDVANTVNLNKTYNGQLSITDSKDYYKFNISENGNVNLKISANIEGSNYYLYDSNENEIWKKTAQYWDDNSKKLSINNTIQLKKGTYYFLVERYSDYLGSYNFSINQKVNNTEIKATSIKLNKKSYTLGVGQKFTLKATVSPTRANQKCKWTSSNSKIASVDKNGKVVAKKIGTINITATTTNGKKAICKITVKKAPTGIKLNKTKLTIKKGRKYILKATLPKGSLNTLKWTTSNGRIATVNSKGLVTGKKKGKATITVKTYNGKSAKCKVTVK